MQAKLLLLGALALPAAAAILPVVDTGFVLASTTTAVDTTGATLLVLPVAAYRKDASACVVSDSKGNTWRHTPNSAGDGEIQTAIWYAADKNGGALSVGSGHTVTANCNGGTLVQLQAYSGTPLDPLDQQAVSATGIRTTTVQPGSVTPSADGELVISFVSGLWGSAFAIGSPLSVTRSRPAPSDNVCGAVATFVQPLAANLSPTWTVTNGFHLSAVIVSFKRSLSVSQTRNRIL